MRGSGGHAGPAGGALRSGPSRSASVDSASGADAPCVEALDYARALRLLAVVLTDGSCVLLRAAESGLLPVEQLQRLHWVCGPGSGALTARIGGLYCRAFAAALGRLAYHLLCIICYQERVGLSNSLGEISAKIGLSIERSCLMKDVASRCSSSTAGCGTVKRGGGLVQAVECQGRRACQNHLSG